LNPQSLTNSFTNSAFRSPFGLNDKFSFFDLSGKTSKVDSVLPESIAQKFQAPEPPKFQDIYGLNTGESPLGKSGYGNAVKPYQGSALANNFFEDKDIKDTMEFGLSADEMDIPKEEDEETTTKATNSQARPAVTGDPGYDPQAQGEGGEYYGDGNYYYGDDYYPSEEPPSASSSPSSSSSSSSVYPPSSAPYSPDDDSLPPGYGSTNLGVASFLPSNVDDDTRDNINISQRFHNGRSVPADYVSEAPGKGSAGKAGVQLGEGLGSDFAGNFHTGSKQNQTSPEHALNSFNTSASTRGYAPPLGGIPGDAPPPIDGYDVTANGGRADAGGASGPVVSVAEDENGSKPASTSSSVQRAPRPVAVAVKP
jgi:hypothetical protein